MWNYRRKECDEDRKLRLNEYSSPFLRWAQRYLQHNPAFIIEAGGSLADLLIQKIAGRQSATHLKIQAAKREEKRQKLIEQASEPVKWESIQGKPVHLVPHGDVSIGRPAPLKPLTFRLTTEKAKEILELKETPCVCLTLEALHLRVNEAVVYKRPVDRLLMSGQREDWMLQVSHEVQVLGGSIPASDASANTEKWKTTEFRKKLLGGGDFSFKDHRSTICDIRILVLEAIGDTIFLQAEPVAEGREHSDWGSE